MPDLELTCVQCRTVFIFTEKEQEIFYQRNMMQPQRCQNCRPPRKKKANKPENATTEEKAPRFEIVCDVCGRHDSVPFKPKVGRSVMCSECYGASRTRLRNFEGKKV